MDFLKKKKKKNKRGRPRIEIDKKTFEGLCEIQCTAVEMAGFFRCSQDTLERWCKREYGKTFEEVFAQYRESGKISLRRSQWRLAQKSAVMGIWLGKQYLGQKDETTVNQNVAPIVIKDDLDDGNEADQS